MEAVPLRSMVLEALKQVMGERSTTWLEDVIIGWRYDEVLGAKVCKPARVFRRFRMNEWEAGYVSEFCQYGAGRYAEFLNTATIKMLPEEGTLHVITNDTDLTNNGQLQLMLNAGLNHIPLRSLDEEFAIDEVEVVLDKILTIRRCDEELSLGEERYLVCHTDKAPHTPTFACINFIRRLALQRLSGLDFTPLPDTPEQATARLMQEAAAYTHVGHEALPLPHLMTVYNAHKQSFRWITNTADSVLSPVAVVCECLLKLLAGDVQALCTSKSEEVRAEHGVKPNFWWPISSIGEFVANIPGRIYSIFTGDITRCFETIPTDESEDGLLKAISFFVSCAMEWRRARTTRDVIAIRVATNDTLHPYWVAGDQDRDRDRLYFDKQGIIDVCEWLVSNGVVQMGNRVWKQILGIPMGLACSPIFCDVYFFKYDYGLISHLFKMQDWAAVRCFEVRERELLGVRWSLVQRLVVVILFGTWAFPPPRKSLYLRGVAAERARVASGPVLSQCKAMTREECWAEEPITRDGVCVWKPLCVSPDDECTNLPWESCGPIDTTGSHKGCQWIGTAKIGLCVREKRSNLCFWRTFHSTQICESTFWETSADRFGGANRIGDTIDRLASPRMMTNGHENSSDQALPEVMYMSRSSALSGYVVPPRDRQRLCISSAQAGICLLVSESLPGQRHQPPLPNSLQLGGSINMSPDTATTSSVWGGVGDHRGFVDPVLSSFFAVRVGSMPNWAIGSPKKSGRNPVHPQVLGNHSTVSSGSLVRNTTKGPHGMPDHHAKNASIAVITNAAFYEYDLYDYSDTPNCSMASSNMDLCLNITHCTYTYRCRIDMDPCGKYTSPMACSESQAYLGCYWDENADPITLPISEGQNDNQESTQEEEAVSPSTELSGTNMLLPSTQSLVRGHGKNDLAQEEGSEGSTEVTSPVKLASVSRRGVPTLRKQQPNMNAIKRQQLDEVGIAVYSGRCLQGPMYSPTGEAIPWPPLDYAQFCESLDLSQSCLSYPSCKLTAGCYPHYCELHDPCCPIKTEDACINATETLGCAWAEECVPFTDSCRVLGKTQCQKETRCRWRGSERHGYCIDAFDACYSATREECEHTQDKNGKACVSISACIDSCVGCGDCMSQVAQYIATSQSPDALSIFCQAFAGAQTDDPLV
ncbi:hypothetical protein CBR_g51098 [Chara braunii]|uniref:Uncharacterized protein n=1 Tax=Chara braunii TaxID=69332 RepID=A0A388K626_CHABU|nr:hypothetical protein CBR_g51098 [Chara braunii]|eukprot:GBG65504.1 hypothetical protein CBR_g51098 [Chara braunii]